MNIDRLSYLRKAKNSKDRQYVLYWMQQSMRVNYNHALLHAINIANKEDLPLLVFFSLTPNYIGANLRHYKFMLEGLKEVQLKLEKLKINFVIKLGEPLENIKEFLEYSHTLIMDYGYLKPQKLWRRNIYSYIKEEDININVDLVESDVLVPVRKLYKKAAYGAHIIRPHLIRRFNSYRDFIKLPKIKNSSTIKKRSDIDLNDIKEILNELNIDKTVKSYKLFKGGHSEALIKLRSFIVGKANKYIDRSDPSLQIQSYLSPYLHFGQISVLEVIDIMENSLKDKVISKEVYDAYIEQLVVRRELSFNYVTYVNDYDVFEYMTVDWAYKTMKEHKEDEREYIYTLEQLEKSMTHDKYFNAAMKEMKLTGYMAGYMRMYWAKKIMEWTKSMKEAYEITVYLNNKYFLDGRDPNSYASIAWCYGKNDRPWFEREIFGKLRYMNDKGLERKFLIDDYVSYVNDIEDEELE